jgi:hypothetical protein
MAQKWVLCLHMAHDNLSKVLNTIVRSVVLWMIAFLPAVASAKTIVVFYTGGRGGRMATRNIVEVLSGKMPEHTVMRQARPRAWRALHVRMARQIGEAARTAGADVGVATMVVKKRRKLLFRILVADSSGTVVFDKVSRLPRRRPERKVKAVLQGMASAIADHLRTTEPPTSGVESLSAAPAAEASAADSEAPVPSSDSAVDDQNQDEETPESEEHQTAMLASPSDTESKPRIEIGTRGRRRAEGFHFAVRAGAGVLSFQDDISSPVKGGDLNIGVGVTLLTYAGLELTYDRFTLAATFHRYTARVGHTFHDDPDTPEREIEITPKEIGASALGGSALIGGGMKLGPLYGHIVAGAVYDSFTADEQVLTNSSGTQETAVLVPSWSRLAPVAGITLAYGGLGAEGLTAQLGLLAVPWAHHLESPKTSGASSSVLGGRGWLRFRYQLPRLFGGGGGLFIEMVGTGEYLVLQYKGNGTRIAFGSTDTVQASKEVRLSTEGGLSIGYVY